MLCSVRRILKLSGSFQSKVKKGIVFGILESMFSCAPLLFMYLFIKDMINENLSYTSVFKYTIGLAVCLLIQYIFHLKETETISSVGYEVIADKRKEVARFLKKMLMGDFFGKTLGEINAIVTNELTQIELYAMQLVSKVVSSVTSLVLTVLFLSTLNVSMTIAFFSGFPISYLLNRIIRKMYVRSAKVKLEAETKLIENTVEYTQGIATVKAYNNGENHSKRMKNIFREFADQTIKSDAKMIPLLQSYSMFMYLGFGVALSLGSYLLMNQRIDYGVFLMFSVIGIQIYQPFEILSAYDGTLKAMEASLDKVEHLMKFKPMEEPERDFECKNFHVEFSNVTFGYNEKNILKNISFVAKENTMTAITGPSGSGKTTLIQLIMRFWDIESGEIKIGGRDIRQYKIETLMKYISVVFQDNYLFNDTIYNNIKYGNEKATKEEIEKAARLACCHEFIENLPKGYETIVGEGGSTLSGGERQRIAIARAIVKDSPIIILDEATSGVDPINEIEIQKGIANLVKGKTVFIIAHKFAAITDADKILVLDEGILKEEGTHDALIQKNGIYQNLWKGQIGVNQWKIRSN
ncbi:ABC transporter ATP-binding protein [Crassaminicella profunda]|uniref:ABC transporter ATP-binding protein n=1 Tax=Crassaminicella profunda TaxID=1286698 RepID=UPI001CA7036F|nr:ABC transporter ATP-binding protein [Crassaminicella profunda]QZY53867.1 ABC transporter ATP-binding protein/permease [Crassaminicella profunda]